MSERDELRATLSDTICNASNYTKRAQPHLLGSDMSAVLDKTTAAVLAAGYHKPRQITTVEELDALPYGSAVLTSDISDTVVLRSDREYFVNQSGCTINARTLWDYGSKPFTVLWEPLP